MSARPFRVVALAREYGSGGAAIATTLARHLGYQLLDRTLIERLAAAVRIDPELAERFDEHVDPWVQRVWRSLWYGGFDAVSGVDEDDVVDADRLARVCGRIIEEAASVGECVIVGRGGQCLLRGRPDVFHVFVYADRETRLRRLRARLESEADVEVALEETDRERAAYIRRHFDQDWRDPRLYQLMVNASIGEEAAVATILTALEAARGS